VAWSGARCVAVGESAVILVASCGYQDFGIDSVSPTLGPVAGGTPVTLHGRGFGGGATVRFGGVEASGVAVVGSTTITAVTQGHAAGAVDVTVGESGGRTATLVAGFTYADVVSLSVSLDPATMTLFAGTTGTLTVSVQPAPSGAVVVTLSSSDEMIATVPRTVTIAAAQTSATFSVTGMRPGGPVHITATLPASAGGGSAVADVTVRARAVVAAVAHAPGLQGSQWRTDVAVVNPSTQAATLALSYVSGSDVLNRTVVLAGGGTVAWGDVLASQFGYGASASTKGTLEVVSDVPVLVSARTYNLAGDGGTFGQFMPGVTEAMALVTGEVGYLPQLQRTDGFRTNVGVVNLGNATVSVRIRLWSGAGTMVGERTVSVGALQTVQETDIFTSTGAGTQAIAYATVEPTTAGAVVWAYGSVADNLTNDPTTVPLVIPVS
jgi:hypothetical protein